MAKATVGAAGIEYIQGALKKPKKENGHKHGNYLVMTHRTAPTTSPDCQRIYSKPVDAYDRKSELTAGEMAQRAMFTTVARAVAARSKDLSKVQADLEAFNAQKDQPGGKTTMKSFLWSLEKAAYEEGKS